MRSVPRSRCRMVDEGRVTVVARAGDSLCAGGLFPDVTHPLAQPRLAMGPARHGSDSDPGPSTPHLDAFPTVARTDSLAQDIVVFIFVD